MENDVLLAPSTYPTSPNMQNVMIRDPATIVVSRAVPVTPIIPAAQVVPVPAAEVASVAPEYNIIQNTNSLDYTHEPTSSNIDYIGIGLAIFIIIIIIISLIIYFISLTSFGTSRAGLIDDEHTYPAYNRG